MKTKQTEVHHMNIKWKIKATLTYDEYLAAVTASSNDEKHIIGV